MKKICEACGQEREVKTEDITEDCTVECHEHNGMFMVAIVHNGETQAIIGLAGGLE